MKTIIVVISMCLLSLTVGAWASTPASYEYKFEYKCTEKKANEFGSQGWELVSISAGHTEFFSTCVFKRGA